jgi:rSAM/selenodomain-associated transferase 1
MTKDLLMIMAKVPEMGKVKTRLAETIGDEGALKVYLKLLQHTFEVASHIEADKIVYFTESKTEFDMLDYYKFDKAVQPGGDLGERMSYCFRSAFDKGYERVIIIGSDCFALDTKTLSAAMASLVDKDFVIGPAEDGGYYLLGMTKMHEQLFLNKTWSTSDVFLDSILDMKNSGLAYEILPTLNDVDRESDLDDELKDLIS